MQVDGLRDELLRLSAEPADKGSEPALAPGSSDARHALDQDVGRRIHYFSCSRTRTLGQREAGLASVTNCSELIVKFAKIRCCVELELNILYISICLYMYIYIYI